MDELFSSFMCKDFLSYDYNEKKRCFVSKCGHPRFDYDETNLENIIKVKTTNINGSKTRRHVHGRLRGCECPRKLGGSFLNSDEHSPNESGFHSVSQNHSPNLTCRGTFHQGWHDSFHYPGQQCSVIALVAIFYSNLIAVDTCKATNVDEVLLLGDKIHFNQLCYLKKNPKDDQKLTLDEVPNRVMMLNYTFSNASKEIVAGTIKKESDLEKGFPTLEDAFRKCQSEKGTGIVLRVLDYCIGCVNGSSS